MSVQQKQQLKTGGVTREQLKDIRETFNRIDTDGDGHLTAGEFKKMLQCTGQNPTDADAESILKAMNKDYNSTVSFEEFLEFMKSPLLRENPHQDLLDAFHLIDKDGNGKISREELKAILTLSGDSKAESVDKIMDEFDTNKDGVLEYKEFVKLWTQW